MPHGHRVDVLLLPLLIEALEYFMGINILEGKRDKFYFFACHSACVRQRFGATWVASKVTPGGLEEGEMKCGGKGAREECVCGRCPGGHLLAH